jgi:hypothetical protein
MFRAVLTILIGLPMLMPQGVCLRKFDCMAGFLRTSPATPVRTERAESRHPKTCRCGCQERVAQESAEGTGSVDALEARHAPPPPQEPCCPAICKAKLDKIVQVENPQPVAVVAFVGVTVTPTTHACTPPLVRVHPTSHAPPLYISFCTLLI